MEENKERFVIDLNAAFARNDKGMAFALAEDAPRYMERPDGTEVLYTSYRSINVTGDSLTAIAEEYIRLVNGEPSHADMPRRHAAVDAV